MHLLGKYLLIKKNKMKKFIITTLLALSVCSTALAADLFTERFYAFSNRDKE